MKLFKFSLLTTLVSVGMVAICTTGTVQAQDKMPSTKTPVMKTAVPKGPVYLCKDGKCYFTPSDAKKMGFNDPMGSGKLKKVNHAPKNGMLMTPEIMKAMHDSAGGTHSKM